MGLEAIQLIFAIYPLCDFGGYHELFNHHPHVEDGDSNSHLQVLLESKEGREWSMGAEWALCAQCRLPPAALAANDPGYEWLWPPNSSNHPSQFSQFQTRTCQ